MRQVGGGGSEELTNCSLLVFIPHFWLLKDKTRTKRSETLIILLKEINCKRLLINGRVIVSEHLPLVWGWESPLKVVTHPQRAYPPWETKLGICPFAQPSSLPIPTPVHSLPVSQLLPLCMAFLYPNFPRTQVENPTWLRLFHWMGKELVTPRTPDALG